MSDTPPADVRVRRAPRFGAFMVVGGGLAAIGTLVATAMFPSDPSVGFVALFAYFCLFTIPAGVAVGAVVALLLDRRSSRRARTVHAEREIVGPEADAAD